MPRPTLNNIRNAPDYATVYQWNVEIIVPPVRVTVPRNFNFQIMTHNLPFVTNETIEVAIRGHKVVQPGIQNYSGSLEWQAVETVDNAIIDMLEEWKDIQWDPQTGAHIHREDGKAVVQLELLDRQDRTRKIYQVRGCMLETFNPGDLDGSSSDTQKPSGTFRFDDYTYG